MSLSTMTPEGEEQVPTQGGAVSLETLARITVLEQELAELKSTIASDSAYGLAKVTNATDVTQESGIALSAMQNNASVEGTLRNEIQTLISEKNGDWQSVPITSFSPGFSASHGADGIHCLKKSNGQKRINGILTVSNGFSLNNNLLFSVPNEFSLNSNAQVWFYMVSSTKISAITLVMQGAGVYYWSGILIEPGTYIIDLIY